MSTKNNGILTLIAPRPIPPILFRILHSGGTHKAGIPFSPTPPLSPPPSSNALSARNPRGAFDPLALDNHLSWTRFPTPFISLCTFPTACEYIKLFRSANATNILLIAIDTDGLAASIRSASVGAWQLGYHDEHGDGNRKAYSHEGEWLLCGSLPAVPRRVIAVLPAADDTLLNNTLSIDTLAHEVMRRTDVTGLLTSEEQTAVAAGDEAAVGKLMAEVEFRMGKKYAGGWRELVREVLRAMGREKEAEAAGLEMEVVERETVRQEWENTLERMMRGLGVEKGKGTGKGRRLKG